MSRKNFPHRKEKRREEAKERQAAHQIEKEHRRLEEKECQAESAIEKARWEREEVAMAAICSAAKHHN